MYNEGMQDTSFSNISPVDRAEEKLWGRNGVGLRLDEVPKAERSNQRRFQFDSGLIQRCGNSEEISSRPNA